MTAAARNLPDPMTVEEFLDWDGDGTGTRYDLVEGVPRAHAAPSGTHSTIHSMVSYALTGHLLAKRPECRVLIGGGVQPNFRSDWNFRQPDLAVTCTPNEKGEKSIPDPSIIIELLSPSNAADTWDNVRNYMTLPSVHEIVVIYTTRVRVDVLVRDATGAWPNNPVELSGGASIPFDSIGLMMPVMTAYRGTYLGA